MREGFEGERIHVYVWLSPFPVHLKLSHIVKQEEWISDRIKRALCNFLVLSLYHLADCFVYFCHFDSARGSPFSISCKEGLGFIYSLSFCLLGKYFSAISE